MNKILPVSNLEEIKNLMKVISDQRQKSHTVLGIENIILGAGNE